MVAVNRNMTPANLGLYFPATVVQDTGAAAMFAGLSKWVGRDGFVAFPVGAAGFWVVGNGAEGWYPHASAVEKSR